MSLVSCARTAIEISYRCQTSKGLASVLETKSQFQHYLWDNLLELVLMLALVVVMIVALVNLGPGRKLSHLPHREAITHTRATSACSACTPERLLSAILSGCSW